MQKQKTYTTRAAALAAFRKAAKEEGRKIKTIDLDKVEIVDGIEELRAVQARYVEEAA